MAHPLLRRSGGLPNLGYSWLYLGRLPNEPGVTGDRQRGESPHGRLDDPDRDRENLTPARASIKIAPSPQPRDPQRQPPIDPKPDQLHSGARGTDRPLSGMMPRPGIDLPRNPADCPSQDEGHRKGSEQARGAISISTQPSPSPVPSASYPATDRLRSSAPQIILLGYENGPGVAVVARGTLDRGELLVRLWCVRGRVMANEVQPFPPFTFAQIGEGEPVQFDLA